MHLTEDERRSQNRRGRRSIALAAITALSFSQLMNAIIGRDPASISNVGYAAIIFALGVTGIIADRREYPEWLCGTQWAREHGFLPAHLKYRVWPDGFQDCQE